MERETEVRTALYDSVTVNYASRTVTCGAVSIGHLYGDVFENASVTLNGDGTLTVEGDRVEYGFSMHDVSPSEIPYGVHPDWIGRTRLLKREVVRAGWHRKKDTVRSRVTMASFILVE